MLLDRRYRAPHSRIAAGEESDARNYQHAGIESIAAVRLRKCSQTRVEAALANLGVNSLTQRADMGQHLLAFIPTESELLDRFRCPIKKHPGHDFRMRKVSPPAAHLPNAVVGALPGVFHEGYQILKYVPALLPPLQAHFSCGVPARCVLSVNVELELVGSGVAHAHRLRAFVTGQPAKLEFRQASCAEDVVHDLQIGGIACNGAVDPVAKRPCCV